MSSWKTTAVAALPPGITVTVEDIEAEQKRTLPVVAIMAREYIGDLPDVYPRESVVFGVFDPATCEVRAVGHDAPELVLSVNYPADDITEAQS